MSFYVNSPLAGGFLAKSVEELKADMKGRWDKDTEVWRLYHRLYEKPSLVSTLDRWGSATEETGTTRAAMAYRWVLYHSALQPSGGKGMIIGASSLDQVQQTLDCLRDGHPSKRRPHPESRRYGRMSKKTRLWTTTTGRSRLDPQEISVELVEGMGLWV